MADLSELTHALDWASTLVKRRQAILRAGELSGARRAAEALQTFLRNLTRALDGPPTEDVILGCPQEPGPHLLRFHHLHSGSPP